MGLHIHFRWLRMSEYFYQIIELQSRTLKGTLLPDKKEIVYGALSPLNIEIPSNNSSEFLLIPPKTPKKLNFRDNLRRECVNTLHIMIHIDVNGFRFLFFFNFVHYFDNCFYFFFSFLCVLYV